MKGTLFSADFIKDANNSLRLLELNTDTAIVPEQIDNIDWQTFISILQTNSISELDIIYKPVVHQALVNSLSSSIHQSDVNSIVVNFHDEDRNTIYPTTIEDASNKFILRLAYDESAIFDSTYCKGRLNTYRLFVTNDNQDMVTQFFYSSSEESHNTLEYIINPSNVPDVSIKTINESFNPIDFFKIGHSEETDQQRWEGIIEEQKSADKIIEQYHFHSSNLDSDNCVTSYRTFYVVYGSNLDVLNIHSYKNSSIFDMPSDISSEVDNSLYSNKLADYHYYEYTTNAFKADGAGLLSTDKIQMADDTYKSFADVEVGDLIKSFYISGSPQVENDYDTMNWNYEGSQFPSGSYVTSSAVVFKNTEDLHYHGLIQYVVDGDSQFSGTSKQFLVYDSGSDKTSYKHSTELNPQTDYFYDYQGNLVDLDEVNYYVTTDSNIQIVELDVEDTDTYIISGSTAFNAVVSHNNPCFVAGTQISLASGDVKNIEDIQVGDLVLTYNHETNEIEHKEVEQVIHKNVDSTVKYVFDNGDVLECTLDHPLYSIEGQYVSYKPEQSKLQYGLEVGQTEVGTKILLQDGSSLEIASIEEKHGKVTVYNLHDVKDNHNFFANKMLVHNRCFVAGTEITLVNGDVKNIEDIVIGDEVLTYNEESGKNEKGIVGELKQHEVDSVIRLTLDNENIIITTHEHPFFVEGKGWVKAGELESLDVCKKVDGSESLVSTVEVLKETHTVYNLLSVSENHNFFANGILVHNK